MARGSAVCHSVGGDLKAWREVRSGDAAGAVSDAGGRKAGRRADSADRGDGHACLSGKSFEGTLERIDDFTCR